jgi:hypothetical protein
MSRLFAILICSVIGVVVMLHSSGHRGANAVEPVKSANEASANESLRGRIVWLGNALKKRGVEVDPDAVKSAVALETTAGQLVPIVKDARGRGFQLDSRLHRFDYEMTVRRVPDSPYVQLVRVSTWHDGKRYELDYWCDICAIPMYEIKECECCQGPIRLRERLLGPDGPGAERKIVEVEAELDFSKVRP